MALCYSAGEDSFQMTEHEAHRYNIVQIQAVKYFEIMNSQITVPSSLPLAACGSALHSCGITSQPHEVKTLT